VTAELAENAAFAAFQPEMQVYTFCRTEKGSMSANVQLDHVPERIVADRGVAILFVLSSASTLYLRIRHLSARFSVPEYRGAGGFAWDLIIYIGFAIVMLGLFGATRDRAEKIGIVACFVSAILKPLQMFFPAYAAAIWWVSLVSLLVFLLASVATLLKLNRLNRSADGPIDPQP
jgi:hypothetical protein